MHPSWSMFPRSHKYSFLGEWTTSSLSLNKCSNRWIQSCFSSNRSRPAYITHCIVPRFNAFDFSLPFKNTCVHIMYPHTNILRPTFYINAVSPKYIDFMQINSYLMILNMHRFILLFDRWQGFYHLKHR